MENRATAPEVGFVSEIVSFFYPHQNVLARIKRPWSHFLWVFVSNSRDLRLFHCIRTATFLVMERLGCFEMCSLILKKNS